MFGSSSWKRSIVPVILLPWIARGEFSAMLPAVRKLFEDSPGIPNQRNASSASEPYSHFRYDGT